MAQIVKADTLHLVCDQKIREMLAQEIGPNPLSHRVYIDVVTVEHLQEMLGICRKNAYLLVKQNKIHSARVGRSYKIPKLCVVEYLLDQDRQLGGMHLSNSLVPSLQNTPESSKLMMPKQRTFGCEQKGA